MLILLSPAKRLDFENPARSPRYTEPRLLKETEILADDLKGYSEQNIQKLMGVSEAIAELNHERFQSFKTPFTKKNAKQALEAFKGDVYRDIDIENYSDEEFEFAQEHVRMLSGFYGVLRPFDLMQPYRLEMHTKMKNERGKNLYEFWGPRIAKVLNEDLAEYGYDTIVNLASKQYFDAVESETLGAKRVVTPVFKEKKKDGYKIVALFAKLARGTMTNFAVKHRIDDPEGLKDFSEDGYKFAPKMSKEDEWVFVRG